MTFTQISLSIRFQMPDRIQAYSFSCTLPVTAFFVVFLFLHTEGLWPPYLEQVCWHHLPDTIWLLCVSMSHFGNF